MRKNKIRDLIKQGQPTIGTHIHSSWPGVTEVIGHTGLFDYVEFTSLYAPYDLYALDNLARATELVGLSSMIKIDQEPRTYLAQRAISSGIQAILFADIFSVEDAKECARAVKTAPEGVNGLGLWRIAGYIFKREGKQVPLSEYVKYLNEVVVAVMIEKESAVENLEEILSVKGVDMVQFGPGDYSISIGHPGEWNHPKVKDAELKTIRTALDMGIRPRAECSVKDTNRYIKLGVQDFCIGTDLMIISDWCQENGGKIRELLSEV